MDLSIGDLVKILAFTTSIGWTVAIVKSIAWLGRHSFGFHATKDHNSRRYRIFVQNLEAQDLKNDLTLLIKTHDIRKIDLYAGNAVSKGIKPAINADGESATVSFSSFPAFDTWLVDIHVGAALSGATIELADAVSGETWTNPSRLVLPANLDQESAGLGHEPTFRTALAAVSLVCVGYMLFCMIIGGFRPFDDSVVMCAMAALGLLAQRLLRKPAPPIAQGYLKLSLETTT